MTKIIKHLTPPRLIALGFALAILLGSLLLMLPCSCLLYTSRCV